MSITSTSEAEASRQLLQLALRNAGRSVALQVVAVVVIAGLGFDAGRALMAWLVAGTGGAVAVSRWWLARHFAGPGALDEPAERKRAILHLELNSLLAGLMWVIATFGIYTHLQGSWPTAYVIFACGSISTAAFFMSLAGRSFAMLAVPQIGALAGVSLLSGQLMSPSVAVLIVLFGITMYRVAGAVSDTAGRAILHSLRADEATERLQQAKEAADAASVAKSQFLATMSHEIRTPMNAVLGSLDLLRHSALDADQRRLVKTAASSGAALMSILNDVLDHSKIEAGELQLTHAPMSLRAVASTSVNLFRANAQAKALEIVFEMDDTVPDRVLGDAQRLKQVLLNLIGNAIKFTEHGSVRLRLSQASRAHGQPRVLFEVTDSGIGIDDDALSRLFQPFQQASAATNRRRSGTGLGLAISQRIVEAMGSRIVVRSQPGIGSAFSFEIDLQLDTSPIDEETGADSAQAQLLAQQFNATVLLVEDNPVNRLIAVQMLHMLGAQVLEVHDGQQAVEAIERYPVDLVLMDCQMPVMDGYSATRAVRERERTKGIARLPIVALTAEAFDHDLLRAREAGMDAHLSKPYTLEELRDVLQVWL